MELTRLIEACSRPDAYPAPPPEVEVRQTHISVVFLTGDLVYKIKKPLRLEFLDYSTLALRRHFCEEEVRLNRRLAPDVYLGVVPVTRSASGCRVEGQGEVVEWAVKMRRLPDEATLAARLARNEVDGATMEALARQVASFHAQAEGGPRIAPFGRFEVVASNVRENLIQAERQVGVTLGPALLERLRAQTERALAEHRSLIEARAARGVPRDTHGDLRLEHVYLFPERAPPDDLVIVDCIEFNERLRFADPIADMAFLTMDLESKGHRAFANAFVEAYLRASGDAEGGALLRFYVSYRAAVRAKVRGIELNEPEIPAPAREAAREKARGSWLLALAALEAPERRPCLVLVGGLPGTGKSTLAQGLADQAGFAVVRSDVVRKERAGPLAAEEDLYASQWTERTYTVCLERARELLFAGKRVLVDATFREDRWREAFLEAAARWAVPAVFYCCRCSPEVARKRLQERRGDVSDADWSVYLQLAERWEAAGERATGVLRVIATDAGAAESLRQAREVLRAEGLG